MSCFRISLLLISCSIFAAIGLAKPVDFDLPSKLGHKSLMAFSRQASVEVLFSYADLKKVKTVAVVGIYEPDVALALLLEDTGFEVEKTLTGKFSVKRKTKLIEPEANNSISAISKQKVRVLDRTSENEDYITLAAFNVTPSRFGIAQERMGTEATLTADQIKALPQFGEDLYRLVTRLPGLSSTDTSAKFWVRGGPNNQALSRLDGVDLIEPFHLKDYDGALSIVDPETISSVNLVTGGFTTNYGDKLTGVMEIETQSNAGEKGRSTLGLSVTNLRATSQGNFADGKGQWLMAARRGYIDVALELGGVVDDVDDAPMYYDLSGKVSYDFNDNHSVSLHMLHAGDTFKIVDDYADPDLNARYDSTYLWGRWQGQLNERVSGEAVLSYSRLDWDREGDGFYEFVHPFLLRDDRQLDVFGIRNDWTINLTGNALIRTGFEYKSSEAKYDYSMSRTHWTLNSGNLGTDVREVDVDLAPKNDYSSAYIALRFKLGDSFVVEPGIRFDYNTHTDESTSSPRFNGSYVKGRTAVRVAWGEYEQAHGLHELSAADGETRFQRSESAEQRVLGISHRLDNGVDLRLELYDRSVSDPRTHWENYVSLLEVIPEAQYDRYEVNPSQARANGVEFFIENRDGGTYDWGLSYSNGKSEERVAGVWVPRARDQEHTFTADFTWIPNRKWQFGVSFEHHSGWPFTDINFSEIQLNDGTFIDVWTFGEANGLRSPNYQRLDLRATRLIQFKNSALRLYFDIFNALDHDNIYGFEDPLKVFRDGSLVTSKETSSQLFLLPTFGISWEF